MKTLIKPTHTIISDTNRTLNRSFEKSRAKCCFQMSNTRSSTNSDSTLLPGGVAAVPVKEVVRRNGGELETRANKRRKTLRQNKVLLMLGCTGSLLLAMAAAVYYIDPLQVLSRMRLKLTPGSFLFNVWQEPPVEVFVRMYVFAVQNPEAFLDGEEKYRVQELGPFTYKEVLVNSNATFNDNNTITYEPNRKVYFRPDMSCDIPLDTYIMVPNVPYIGFVAMMADYSFVPNVGLLSLTTMLKSKPFLNITIQEYLWGYEDPLTTMASTVLPSWITFEKFGLMDRMFDDGSNLVTMNVNEKAQLAADGRVINPLTIDQYNGSPGLSHWGYDPADNKTHKSCNTLQGVATEGIVFHQNIHPNDTFLIYRKAFCRTIKLEFDRAARTPSDVPVFYYKIPDDVYNNSNPENICFQPAKGPSLPWGLSDVTPCYYQFPAAVSFPHFFNADPKLREAIDGMRPNKTEHATYVIIQPDIGVPMEVHSRMQTNLVVGNTRYHPKIRPFNDITIPLFWADLSLNGLPEDLTSMINLLLLTGPVLQSAAILSLACSGAILLLVTMARYWWSLRGTLRTRRQFNISRYSAVRIIS